ncbi:MULTISPECIES: hypothetical protein [unclassified Bradyrhizobium]|uniref:hypothetical protein n=1 Tax=unclassified Bradyrhizobium TaxID=2631580 RepID=UPI001CD286CF|nr:MULTISPECIES: hypothetical protein [unclassified Bradyrhizobium]MCA1386483.1 hypothetical protein [Bradyrhizobium sp. BRP05]MCA1394594.1 hypothetical protein [Bradyrhizobium sp. IC3123]MCA1424211.1 hypothetical protein [Bradyrhizobium sp. BRP23]MCA1431274.1 hypothetical protein [Bradyrhizobium sp. NBAIM16]MCA1480697.1 hypothetical protein [Bradyrhizobium sp. NBAIM08]
MGIPIDKVVADVASEIVLVVHYEVTPQRAALADAPARTARQHLCRAIQAVRQLVLIGSDELIAASSTATAARRATASAGAACASHQ